MVPLPVPPSSPLKEYSVSSVPLGVSAAMVFYAGGLDVAFVPWAVGKDRTWRDEPSDFLSLPEGVSVYPPGIISDVHLPI